MTPLRDRTPNRPLMIELIAAYAAAGHVSATVLRFVSVLGPHYHHGLVVDFVRKLQANPRSLEIIAPGAFAEDLAEFDPDQVSVVETEDGDLLAVDGMPVFVLAR